MLLLYAYTVTLLLICKYSVQASQLSDAANCFTLNLHKNLAKLKPNLISSPFSVDVLLSLLRTAAGGNTNLELTKALNYQDPNLSVNEMKEQFESVIDSLVSSDGNTLEMASSLWIQKQFVLNSEFINTATESFKASVDGSMEFKENPSSATTTINKWAETNTNGLIKKLFDEDLPRDTLMVLANAIYFKGNWEKKFDARYTFPQKFYNNGELNQAKDVSMMNQKQAFNYKVDESLKASILEMDYKGGQTSMVIVLPESNLDSLEGSLNCENFEDLFRDMFNEVVQVSVPKFTVESDFDLKDPLKNLGIKDLFNVSGGANLSGLVTGKTGTVPDLAVGDVIQKAVVKVDEEGSEAAAVTGVRVCRACTTSVERDPVFRVDKPFLYFIRHKPTGIVLFTGRTSIM